MAPTAQIPRPSSAYQTPSEPGPDRPTCAVNFEAFSAIRSILNSRPRPTRGPRSCFANHLMLYLPEIAERIDEADYGELHLEIGELKLASREAIQAGDWHAVREQFTFVDHLLAVNSGDVAEAISVSYLGALFYGELSRNHAIARCLLPRRLAIALEKIERHYEELAC